MPGMIVYKECKERLEELKKKNSFLFQSRELYLQIFILLEHFKFKSEMRKEILKLFSIQAKLKNSNNSLELNKKQNSSLEPNHSLSLSYSTYSSSNSSSTSTSNSSTSSSSIFGSSSPNTIRIRKPVTFAPSPQINTISQTNNLNKQEDRNKLNSSSDSSSSTNWSNLGNSNNSSNSGNSSNSSNSSFIKTLIPFHYKRK